MNSKFSLGQVVATRGVIDLFGNAETFSLLYRHAKGDWSNLYPEDKEQNESALLSKNNRLFSAYDTSKDKISMTEPLRRFCY